MTEEEHKAKVQQIKDLFRLSDKQVAEITKNVISVMAKDILPSKDPLVVVVGGQSGSGKTALINYTAQISNKREFVQIDNDFFRSFHPAVDQIKRDYPDYYVNATDQLGLGITADVIEYFKSHHYNIILHQTLKNNRVVDDAIAKFLDAGYTVGVRVFAVPYLESKMSQIERCQGQLETLKFCRHVAKEDHDTAISGIPLTADYIEQTGKYNFIEVYRRDTDISQPKLVYAHINENNKEHTLDVLSECQCVSHQDQFFGFNGARDAIEKTRATEAVKCAKTLDARILQAEQSSYNNAEMQLHIDELKERLEVFRTENKQKKLSSIAIRAKLDSLSINVTNDTKNDTL